MPDPADGPPRLAGLPGQSGAEWPLGLASHLQTLSIATPSGRCHSAVVDTRALMVRLARGELGV